MSDRDLAESRYRVNGKTVEALHNGEWVTAFYCVSEERAVACRQKCINRYIEYLGMSDEERRRSILRSPIETAYPRPQIT